MLALAGQQVANGANDLATQVSDGLGEVKELAAAPGPFHVSDAADQRLHPEGPGLPVREGPERRLPQLGHRTSEARSPTSWPGCSWCSSRRTSSSPTATGSGPGSSGSLRVPPGRRVDSSGRVAWISLTQFVRATVIVAITDAVGVMIAASILQVQFVLAIGVLVFLGAFVPIVGAFVAGTVAVLVAFVDHGIVVALLMLGAVVLVQQIESHVLQPFLMGRFVSIHPLGVIVAIAAGILLAGIPGALVAVPFAAAANAVVQHLASETQGRRGSRSGARGGLRGHGTAPRHRCRQRRRRRRRRAVTRRMRGWPTSSTPTGRTAAPIAGGATRSAMADVVTGLGGGHRAGRGADRRRRRPDADGGVAVALGAHRQPGALKCENLQRTGSFKVRGAYTRMCAPLGGGAGARRGRGVGRQPCAGCRAGGAVPRHQGDGVHARGGTDPQGEGDPGVRRGRRLPRRATSRTRWSPPASSRSRPAPC